MILRGFPVKPARMVFLVRVMLAHYFDSAHSFCVSEMHLKTLSVVPGTARRMVLFLKSLVTVVIEGAAQYLSAALIVLNMPPIIFIDLQCVAVLGNLPAAFLVYTPLPHRSEPVSFPHPSSELHPSLANFSPYIPLHDIEFALPLLTEDYSLILLTVLALDAENHSLVQGSLLGRFPQQLPHY